ncbi:hypothetical protein [Devosia sp.]|uniref:hypothetical protein n=1 Tax=Devosia sp. TaxID=1871048 RepID=UPI002AFF52E3|nr:hypothetical protein [Devosia sp.]
MPVARLLVERGMGRTPSQDWGEFDFLALPSPGDRIAASFDNALHHLTVISVHHKPVPIADQRPDKLSPQADVVAKWTSSE